MPNNKVTDADALAYHLEPTPGKFEITASVPMTTQRDLSLAYSRCCGALFGHRR